MQTVGRELLLVVSFLSTVSCVTYTYSLNDAGICGQSAVVLKWIEEKDVIKVHGKRGEPTRVSTCEIKFGPSSLSKKQVIKMMFDSYFVKDCNIYLVMQQSSSAFFEKDVSTVFNLTCLSKPGKVPFYTKSGNNVRIYLHKSHANLLNYNFIFNMTLTEDQGKIGGLSTAILVGIGILIAIAIPGVGCVVYRYMKIKRWTKEHYEADETDDLSPHTSHRLSHQSTPLSIRYSSLPVGQHEDTAGHNTHSQTCIVGSREADGSCTVCGRIHEDFAHVVDVSSDNQVHDISSRDPSICQICSEDQQDFAFLVDTNGSTQVRAMTSRASRQPHTCPHRQSSRPTSSQGQRSRISANGGHLVPVRGLIRDDDDWDDSEDIDLSANDLIPPSYDLSPPSYDEAVNMPKPENIVNGAIGASSDLDSNFHRRESLERDPLYQNLDSLHAGAT